MLEEHAIEHREDGELLGLGEAADALELALELGRGPALAGLRARDAEQHIGGDGEERGELGHEGDRDAGPADLVVGEGLLRDAEVCGDRLLREACLLAQLREAAAELLGELPVGGRHGRRRGMDGRALHDSPTGSQCWPPCTDHARVRKRDRRRRLTPPTRSTILLVSLVYLEPIMADTATTTLSSKGQVVIPEEIRDRLGLKAGAQFVVLGDKDVVIFKVLQPPTARDLATLVKQARQVAKRTGMRRGDLTKAIAKARRSK